MDILPLKEQISESIQDIPVGLRWKMVNMGTQGQVKEADQVRALHLFVDELDIRMAKPLLSALYPSRPSNDHTFPLHIRMRLVPKIDSVLNLKGRKNVDKLHACQNNWNRTKLTYIKNLGNRIVGQLQRVARTIAPRCDDVYPTSYQCQIRFVSFN